MGTRTTLWALVGGLCLAPGVEANGPCHHHIMHLHHTTPGIALPVDNRRPLHPTPDFEALLGKLPSRYLGVRHLRTGGMGSAWLAWDKRTGKRVVIKESRQKFGADPNIHEFQALLAARRHVPESVRARIQTPVERIPLEGRHSLLVTEYIPGTDFRELMDTAPLHEAMGYLTQVARTLESLSERHSPEDRALVHRDVTPRNIRIREDGTAVLLDFAFSEREGGVQFINVGSDYYLGPDQIVLKPAHPSMDVWALQVMLKQLYLRENGKSALTPLPESDSVEDFSVSRSLLGAKQAQLQVKAQSLTAVEAARGELLNFVTSPMTFKHRYRQAENPAALFAEDLLAAQNAMQRANQSGGDFATQVRNHIEAYVAPRLRALPDTAVAEILLEDPRLANRFGARRLGFSTDRRKRILGAARRVVRRGPDRVRLGVVPLFEEKDRQSLLEARP